MRSGCAVVTDHRSSRNVSDLRPEHFGPTRPPRVDLFMAMTNCWPRHALRAKIRQSGRHTGENASQTDHR